MEFVPWRWWGLYHLKVLVKAVQKIPFKNFRAGGKVQLQNSIENPMRINKTTHFLHYMRRDLVMRLNRIETIVNQSSRSLHSCQFSRRKTWIDHTHWHAP